MKVRMTVLGRSGVCALALLAGLGAACSAHAEDKPFDFDTKRWISSERYVGEAAKTPADEAAEKKESAEQKKPETQAAIPVATPVLPELKKNPNLYISSTDEQERMDALTPPPASPGKVSAVPEKKWVSPAEKKAFDADRHDVGEGTAVAPLNVRMSYLPSRNVTPEPSPQHESSLEKGRALLKKAVEDKRKAQEAAKEKEQQDTEACAALDAYKKRQLDALQSDRQTLKDLQDAIKSLGYEKKLDFMTETGGTISAAGTDTPPPTGAPGKTTVR